ncbi:hypothetical protein, partial [Vibrio parahaemolyticus]|uniref:hypothetical protein n=1 Tax=Vibrio parahaemolyticus TaxID=670 RepID=UPI0019D6257B
VIWPLFGRFTTLTLSLALLPQTFPPVNNLSFQCFYCYHFRVAIFDYFVTHNAALRGAGTQYKSYRTAP